MNLYGNTQQNIKFGRTNSLFVQTLFRMMPLILLASISTFLITTVDGLMVGNADGDEALAAVIAMGPFLTLVGAVTAVVLSGVSIVLPQLEGENDLDKELGGYKATFVLTLIIAIAVAILQIPIAAIVIHSMGFTPEVSSDAWEYSVGLFLANPIDCISTVGTFVLISTGNAGYLLMLSLVEGFIDLTLDYIMVVKLGMGPFGAGLGTAVGILVRCIITLIIIKRKTRFFTFKKQEYKPTAKRMLRSGFPSGFNSLLNAVMAWAFSWLIMDALGIDGMSVKAVLSFVASMSSILISAVMRSAATIIGFRNGIKDYRGVNICFEATVGVIAIFMTVLMILLLIFPKRPFFLYGIDVIPSYGTFAVIMMACSLPFTGCNAVAAYYYQLREKEKTVAVLNFFENLLIPLATAVIARYLLGSQYIWVGYLAGSIAVFVANLVLIGRAMKDERGKANDHASLCLSLTPENVNRLSIEIGQITKNWHLSKDIVNRLSMVIEEIAAYSQQSWLDDEINTDLLITVTDDGIRVVTIDDGTKITELDDDHIRDKSKSKFDNYDVLKSISSKLTYQRIMNTNVITAVI